MMLVNKQLVVVLERFSTYSQTCAQRPPLGPEKRGCNAVVF
jgi:hypothetical protein